MSMISCIPLCGSFLNGAIVPSVYQNSESFGDAFRVGFLLCIVSFILVLILTYLDYKTEVYDKKLLTTYVKDKKEKAKKEKLYQKLQRQAEPSSFDFGGEDDVEYYKLFKQGEDIDENFKCKDLKDLELPFWLTCLSCMCTYIAIINSIVIGSSVLQSRFNYSEVEAGFYFTMPYVIAAIFSPILGWFVDKYGKRMTVTLIGSLLMILAHVYNLLMPDCD